MRIISGSLGGRSIKTVEGPGYRPATSRVREAIFSMLASRGVVWDGTRVLDLFAGSGSLSFEALSRGAAEAVLVEMARDAVNCLNDTIRKFEVEDRCHVEENDVARFTRNRCYKPFDVIFVDPPYGQNRLLPTLKAVLRGRWLAEDGFLVAEVEDKLHLDATGVHEQLELQTDRSYGQTRILIWQLLPNV